MNAHLHPIFQQALAPFAPARRVKFTIEESAAGWVVTDGQGAKHPFAKSWLAMAWIEKQLSN
jgi:hypothetical protein